MRLKQLLGILALLLGTTAVAMAANELKDVKVAAQGNSTVVSVQANGAFTHTEYRPTENLFLVDMNGVSSGTWKDKANALEMPGVTAYHVTEYKGASGADVTRIELTVAPGATLNVAETDGGLNIMVVSTASAAAPAKAPAPVAPAAQTQSAAKAAAPVASSVAPAEKESKAEAQASNGSQVVVKSVSVVKGDQSLDIEVSCSGPATPKVTRLAGKAPNAAATRLVLDFTNAVSGRAQKVEINVGDIKDVRLAQFQANPPVARVVIDMGSGHHYEVIPGDNNKVIVRLHAPELNAVHSPASPKLVQAADKSSEQRASSSGPKLLNAAQTSADTTDSGQPTLAPAVKKESAAKETAPEPKQDAQKDEKAPAAPANANSQAAKDFILLEPKTDEKADGSQAAADKKSKTTVAELTPTDNPAPQAAPAQAQSEPAPKPAAAPRAQVQNDSQFQGMPARQHYTGEPVSVNLKDVDIKDFFRLIHEISGLNIILDPSVHGTLTIVLDDVPWDQALDIVLQNNGLDRQLEGNVLRIATVETLRKEADAVRAKNEAEALSANKITVTHTLSYARAMDLVPTIKKLLSQRGEVLADVRTNSLIIADIPSVLPGVQKLLTQLDRKSQEVEIEARVIASTRTFARDIGTMLGFGWGGGTNTAISVGGVPAVGTSPTSVGYLGAPSYPTTPGITSATTVTSASIPLFSNLLPAGISSGVGTVLTNRAQTFRLDAFLGMAESRGLLKILSRPRVITQNNVQAVVKQGVRVPVVTLAQLGGPPTVTYIDAFLRLTVTPQITNDKTVFLNLDLENTTPDFSTEVQGNPTFLTQQATTSVLVTDGGTVVIGGVIQTNNAVNVSQVPLLGDIPILGNAFKLRSVKTNTQELLFFISPKIIQS